MMKTDTVNESDTLNMAIIESAPDKTISIKLTPEEAKTALLEMIRNPENGLVASIGREKKKMQCEGKIYQKGWEEKGRWQLVETTDSIHARFENPNLKPDCTKWEFRIIIEGWECELVEGAFHQNTHRFGAAGLFEKNSKGIWIAVPSGVSHGVPANFP